MPLHLKYRRISFTCIGCLLLCFIGLNSAIADSQCPSQIHGLSLAGAEFGGDRLPGMAGRDYRFPSEVKLQYYTKAGFNAVRLPVLWERLQPALFGELDKSYSDLLLAFMDQAAHQGQVVVVDVHNYARYRNEVIGTATVPREALHDVWKRLALLLHEHPALYAYGLMNEPNHTQGLWHSVAQAGVDGIREVDSGHLIYVAGDDWSGTASWPKTNPVPFVQDPSNKIVYEGHVYFDDDFSGRYQKPIADINFDDRVKSRVQPFISWLAKYHQKGVIGEWGIPTKDLAYKNAVDSFIAITSAECLDWFIWAGGQWSASYPLSLEPLNDQEKPMLGYLRAQALQH